MLSANDATRLGIPWRQGERMTATTANGTALFLMAHRAAEISHVSAFFLQVIVNIALREVRHGYMMAAYEVPGNGTD